MTNIPEATQARNTLNERSNSELLALIPAGIAMNLAIGAVVHLVKLPLYLDATGTVLITLIAGLRAGVIVGVLSFLIGGLINPALPWFILTQAAIAIFTHYAAKLGGFRSMSRTVLTGLCLGIVAGVVSAPVIIMVFGGITGSGTSLVAAVLLASGKSLLRSVFFSGLASEPLDKAIQCLLAVWLIQGLPPSLRDRFRRDVSVSTLVGRRR